MKLQVLYVRATSNPNVKLDVITDDEIRVTYVCVIQYLVLYGFCSFIYLNNIINLGEGKFMLEHSFYLLLLFNTLLSIFGTESLVKMLNSPWFSKIFLCSHLVLSISFILFDCFLDVLEEWLLREWEDL